MDELRYFRTAEGEALLQEGRALPGDELARLTRLRKRYPAHRCRAAMTLLANRTRGRAKFARAEEMVFDREGLEQSSGEAIAAYRAGRYKGVGCTADLCCGVGGDTIGLAGVTNVVAVDRAPARAAMTRWNAEVNGVGDRVEVAVSDVARWLPDVDAIFVDPGRRKGTRRMLSLTDYLPPVDLDHLSRTTSEIGIKVAPGVAYAEIPHGAEVEFISENGSCKEAVLWFGGLRTNADRRATVLPGEHTMSLRDVDPAAVAPPGSYVVEPDRAVIRAHTIDQLALDLDAWKLDPQVAYLSCDHPVNTPFARSFEVRDVFRFGMKRLQGYIRDHGIGRLEIKKRRFPMEPDEVRRKLKLKGDKEGVLILTRVGGEATAIVCEARETGHRT